MVHDDKCQVKSIKKDTRMLTIRSLDHERITVDSSTTTGDCSHLHSVDCLSSQSRHCGHSSTGVPRHHLNLTAPLLPIPQPVACYLSILTSALHWSPLDCDTSGTSD